MWRVAVLGLVLALGCHHFDAVEAKHVQSTALAVGAAAPDVALTTSSNGKVSLASVMRDHAQTVIVFYRGFY